MDNPQQPDVESDEGLVFHLEVSMGIYHLTAVRRFVAELMQSVVNDQALAARLAMATHELLENAVKYSTNTRRLVSLRVEAEHSHRVRVTVMNASTEELTAPLRVLLAQLNQAPNRDAKFREMIEQSLLRESGSGLGLARISAEAELDLSCELHQGILSVTAETAIGERP